MVVVVWVVNAYRDFTVQWMTPALSFLSAANTASPPPPPLIVWTNLLGRSVIAEVAQEFGYSTAVSGGGEFLWANSSTPAPPPGDVQSSSSSIAAGISELKLRVYECALVMFHTSASAIFAADSPPRVWSVITPNGSGGVRDLTSPHSAAVAHPNHKPFAVIEPLIRQHTRPGDTVLDPFAGSGSIGAAALMLQRNAICIERDPFWCETTRQRLKKLL